MPPDGDTTNAFLYCLGYAASHVRVGVVFFIACSKHHGKVASQGERERASEALVKTCGEVAPGSIAATSGMMGHFEVVR